MELTGSEILVESLKSAGVKVVFGVSGSPLLPVLDVVYRTGGIRYIQAQHEQAAMYMANGYARQSRALGICLVSPGPGETNCVSGVAQAYYTSTPHSHQAPPGKPESSRGDEAAAREVAAGKEQLGGGRVT